MKTDVACSDVVCFVKLITGEEDVDKVNTALNVTNYEYDNAIGYLLLLQAIKDNSEGDVVHAEFVREIALELLLKD